MAELLGDQAEGLRRLLAHNQPRILAFLGAYPRVGVSSLILNLAAGLARMGRSVLVIDEHNGSTSLTTRLAGHTRRELLDAVRAGAALPRVMQDLTEGVKLLPAAHAARHFAELDETDTEQVRHAFAELASLPDVILIDGQMPGQTSSFSLAAQEIVMVMGADKSGLTEVYAQAKKLHQEFARRQLQVLFTRTDAKEADNLFQALLSTARRFLDVRLNLLGVVPADERLQQAGRALQPVVDSFPHSPSAMMIKELAGRIDAWPVSEQRLSQPADLADCLLRSSRLSGNAVSI